MLGAVKPVYLVFLLILVIPGIVGGMLAANRGRNFLGWSLACAIFPIFLLVIYFEKPVREVEGKFRRCGSCGEYYRWRDPSCKYCGTPRPSA